MTAPLFQLREVGSHGVGGRNGEVGQRGHAGAGHVHVHARLHGGVSFSQVGRQSVSLAAGGRKGVAVVRESRPGGVLGRPVELKRGAGSLGDALPQFVRGEVDARLHADDRLLLARALVGRLVTADGRQEQAGRDAREHGGQPPGTSLAHRGFVDTFQRGKVGWGVANLATERCQWRSRAKIARR